MPDSISFTSVDDGSHEPSRTCRDVRAKLDAYVDGEVSEMEAAIVVEHVPQCAHCQSAESSLRQFLAAVRHSQLPVLASRRLRLRIAQLFEAAESQSR